MNHILSGLFIFLKILLINFFGEREREGEREGEKLNVWLPLMCPQLGTWPTTQAWALTGNRTFNPLVRRPALSPLSHTSQGRTYYFVNVLWILFIFLSVFLFVFLRFYLFIFRERGREGERRKERSMCGCLSCGPHWGPGLQPRHVP